MIHSPMPTLVVVGGGEADTPLSIRWHILTKIFHVREAGTATDPEIE